MSVLNAAGWHFYAYVLYGRVCLFASIFIFFADTCLCWVQVDGEFMVRTREHDQQGAAGRKQPHLRAFLHFRVPYSHTV